FLHASGLFIRNCSFTGCPLTSGGHAAFVGSQPAIKLDGSFWIDIADCIIEAGDTSSYSLEMTSELTVGSEVATGIITIRNCALARKGFLISCLYGSQASGIHFYNCLVESIVSGGAFLTMDSTHVQIYDVVMDGCGLADAGSPTYFLKNTGISTNNIS